MANTVFIVSLALLATVGTLAEKFNFAGYELLQVLPQDVGALNSLFQLRERHPGLDFWLEPAPQKNTTVLVPPDLVPEFKAAMKEQHMAMRVLSDDVQSLIDAGNERTPKDTVRSNRRARGQVIDHYNYHTYSKILIFLKKLASHYRKYVRISTLKYRTVEHREVAYVQLTGNPRAGKPVIIIEAGIHAREWISPATNLWFIEKVLQDYVAGDRNAKLMLDTFDWFIVPVTNPDGYEYTHSTKRLWRKNRRVINGGRCVGVDLNRNFDVEFGTTGVSRNCKDDTYPGPKPFSEAETANIRELFNSLYDRVGAYVSVHSYSQLLLVPWGYSEMSLRPPNYLELDRVTKLMTTAISDRHGKTYRHGTAKNLLGYAASGASEDWALTMKPGIIALCLELRPGNDGDIRKFLLPPSEIVGTGEEFYAGLVVMAKEMKFGQSSY